jgi:hypothetical protein
LVEDPPHLGQKARQLPGELGVLFGCIGKIQQFLANQVVKRPLHAEAPLDSLRRQPSCTDAKDETFECDAAG